MKMNDPNKVVRSSESRTFGSCGVGFDGALVVTTFKFWRMFKLVGRVRSTRACPPQEEAGRPWHCGGGIKIVMNVSCPYPATWLFARNAQRAFP